MPDGLNNSNNLISRRNTERVASITMQTPSYEYTTVRPITCTSQTSIDATDHTAPAWTQELGEQQRADCTLGLLISWMEQAGE